MKQEIGYLNFKNRLVQWIEENETLVKVYRREMKYSQKKKSQTAKKQLTKLEKGFKMKETSLSVVLLKILSDYVQNEKSKEQRRNSDLETTSFEVIELDDSGTVLTENKISSFLKKDNFGVVNNKEELERRKDLLAFEIESLSKNINEKRRTMLEMLGWTRALDFYLQDCKDLVVYGREKLKPFRDSVEDEELQRVMFLETGGMQGQDFFEKGSFVTDDNYPKFEINSKKNGVLAKHIADLQFHSQGVFTQSKRKLYRELTRLKKSGKYKELFTKKRIGTEQRNRNNVEKIDSELDFNDLRVINEKVDNKSEYIRDDDLSMVIVEEVEEVFESESAMDRKMKEMIERVKIKAKEKAKEEGVDVDQDDIVIIDDQEVIQAMKDQGKEAGEVELLEYEDESEEEEEEGRKDSLYDASELKDGSKKSKKESELDGTPKIEDTLDNNDTLGLGGNNDTLGLEVGTGDDTLGLEVGTGDDTLGFGVSKIENRGDSVIEGEEENKKPEDDKGDEEDKAVKEEDEEAGEEENKQE